MTFPAIVLVTTVDVKAEGEEEFNRWYNEEHLPAVMACPGFLAAARYRASVGEPRYMAVYELATEAALETPEMQSVRGWGEMFPYVRNFHERVYRQIHEYSG